MPAARLSVCITGAEESKVRPTPSVLKYKTLDNLNLYSNIRHSRILWTKDMLIFFGFDASFTKKINCGGQGE
jgi:hypothetical protein